MEQNRIVGLPIPWFKNLDCSKNWRRKRFRIFEFRLRLNRDDVIINVVGSQIVAHTSMGTGNGPNKPNTINL